MPYCHYCGQKIGEDEVFCPACGLSLVGDDRAWQQFKIRETLDRLRHRVEAYVALSTCLVTVGLVIGIALLLSSYLTGLFGIAFVCLGIAFATAAIRNERKTEELRRRITGVVQPGVHAAINTKPNTETA